MTHYWLIKSEPSCYGIDDLYNSPHRVTYWDGVRNYQARNYMKEMTIGDKAFFYHSNCTTPGIAGIVEVVKQAYPDHTAFDPTSEHPDLNSTPNNPRWYMVDIHFKEKFTSLIPLDQLRKYSELATMALLRKGNRLSVLPVTPDQWNFIINELRES